MTNNEVEATDILEERLINAEYKIWKKNTPYLYDFVLTHALEWPSLTVQWLPHQRVVSKTAIEHSLLLGTHTTGEQNYLMTASAILPSDNAEQEQQPFPNKNNHTETAASVRYDEEKKEVGGFGLADSDTGKIEIKMRIKHEGEVNRARYMPQNHFIVATRGPSPEIYIWDMSKHPSLPDEKSPFCPQGVCMGHSSEGYAMAWSPHVEGRLLTGSDDQTVMLWDVSKAYQEKGSGTQIKPTATLVKHSATVEDVAWHAKDPNMVGSVGDDKRLCIWDVRDKSIVKSVENAHDNDINCVSFNPVAEYMLATGSADSTVAVWDLRNLTKPLFKLQGHTDQVFKVDWSPFNESILGSCSADRRVALWDLSRVGQEQSPEDAEDGPPELLFLHGGHTSKVSDFSWNINDHWSIASVSEDNVLQCWNPAAEIYEGDDDEDAADEDAKAEDGVLGDDELE